MVIMSAVFIAVAVRSWLQADLPYLAVMLYEDGLSVEEYATTLTFRNIAIIAWGIGSSVGLLLLNYYLGKKYKLTRESTIFYLLCLIISILIGTFLGYGTRQLQLPQYPILNLGILALTPGNLLSSITWNMLGMLAGNYMREIKEKETQF